MLDYLKELMYDYLYFFTWFFLLCHYLAYILELPKEKIQRKLRRIYLKKPENRQKERFIKHHNGSNYKYVFNRKNKLYKVFVCVVVAMMFITNIILFFSKKILFVLIDPVIWYLIFAILTFRIIIDKDEKKWKKVLVYTLLLINLPVMIWYEFNNLYFFLDVLVIAVTIYIYSIFSIFSQKNIFILLFGINCMYIVFRYTFNEKISNILIGIGTGLISSAIVILFQSKQESIVKKKKKEKIFERINLGIELITDDIIEIIKYYDDFEINDFINKLEEAEKKGINIHPTKQSFKYLLRSLERIDINRYEYISENIYSEGEILELESLKIFCNKIKNTKKSQSISFNNTLSSFYKRLELLKDTYEFFEENISYQEQL